MRSLDATENENSEDPDFTGRVESSTSQICSREQEPVSIIGRQAEPTCSDSPLRTVESRAGLDATISQETDQKDKPKA